MEAFLITLLSVLPPSPPYIAAVAIKSELKLSSTSSPQLHHAFLLLVRSPGHSPMTRVLLGFQSQSTAPEVAHWDHPGAEPNDTVPIPLAGAAQSRAGLQTQMLVWAPAVTRTLGKSLSMQKASSCSHSSDAHPLTALPLLGPSSK